jgi:hypothetical protein
VARPNRSTRRYRSARPGILGSLREGASDVVQSVVNDVAPGVVGALDVDEVVQRVDIQAVLDRIVVEELVDRIDLNALLDKVDVDLVLSRMDVDALLARVDVQALVKRLDIGEIIDEVDVNALLERVDVDALVERTEIGSIVARSGAGVAAKALDVVRSLGVGLDSFVHGWVDRLLRRDSANGLGGPVSLIDHVSTPPGL